MSFHHTGEYGPLGFEYYVSCDYIYAVRLSFEPEVWVDLLNAGGQWLPSCCADISAVRDILGQALRQNSWIDTQDLKRSVDLLNGHSQIDESNPLHYLMIIWDKVKDHVKDETKKLKTVEYNKPDRMRHHAVFDLMSYPYEPGKHKQRDMMRLLASLFPIIKTVEQGKLWGWGIFDEDGNIVEVGGNLALFTDKEEAQKVFETGREFNISLKPVFVSMKTGLTIQNENL